MPNRIFVKRLYICGYNETIEFMKRGIAITLLAFICICGFSQEYKAVVKGKKIGIQNSAGEWTVKPSYYRVIPFGDNFLVKTNNPRHSWNEKWDLVDFKGESKLDDNYEYKYVRQLSVDLVEMSRVGPKYGVIGTDGKWIIPCSCSKIRTIDLEGERLLILEVDDYRGLPIKKTLVNLKGEKILPGDYYSIREIKVGSKMLFSVEDSEGFMLMDREGRKLLPKSYSSRIIPVAADAGQWASYYSDRVTMPDLVQSGNEIISLESGASYSIPKDKYGFYMDPVYGGIYGGVAHLTPRSSGSISEPKQYVGGTYQRSVKVPVKEFYYKDGYFYENERDIPKAPPIDPSRPPILNIDLNSIRFADASGNNAIDAGETGKIMFKVKNTGLGAGRGCVAKVTTLSPGIKVSDYKLPSVNAGDSVDVEIPVTGAMDISDGIVEFGLSVYEPNGFGCDPVRLSVASRGYVAPYIQVMDFAASNASGHSVKKLEPFSLQLLLQNTKHGKAHEVAVEIGLPENVILMDGEKKTSIGGMEGGKQQLLEYQMIANNNYKSSVIPVRVSVREKFGKYAESRTIEIPLNSAVAETRKIVVDPVSESAFGNIEFGKIEGDRNAASDVDIEIPSTGRNKERTFAVIISNENYMLLSNVPYANNDSRVFAEYCHKTIGIPESNIRYYTDATFGMMLGAMEDIRNIASTFDGGIDLIFYYAGHGAPEEGSKESYLIPVDAYGVNTQGCYSLKKLYADISGMRLHSAVVFMDACFSGESRDGNMLASARGVRITPKSSAPVGNMIVFSAAGGDQTAMPFAEKKHGLFTYFLLKKLKESRGEVTLGELAEYLVENVSRQSAVVNRKPQTPTVVPSVSLQEKWKTMKL